MWGTTGSRLDVNKRTNMKIRSHLIVAMLLAASLKVCAQLPVVRHPNQKLLLTSPDPKLEKNKRLVYDYWRTILEAAHVELGDKFLLDSYMQHNPNVPTGARGLLDLLAKVRQPTEICDSIKSPLVNIVAEGDYVILSFAHEFPDPKDNSKKYTTTLFDMFRIENGKVAEHWDAARRE